MNKKRYILLPGKTIWRRRSPTQWPPRHDDVFCSTKTAILTDDDIIYVRRTEPKPHRLYSYRSNTYYRFKLPEEADPYICFDVYEEDLIIEKIVEVE